MIYIPGVSAERDEEMAREILSVETMNLAERAMNIQAAIACGPGWNYCDDGGQCPNHQAAFELASEYGHDVWRKRVYTRGRELEGER